MGGSMSIENRTNGVPLQVSLNQVGPLYYENVLEPGATFYRETGAVHFTVKAKPNFGRENKLDGWSVALPILFVSGGAIATVATAGVAAASAASAAAAAATAAEAATVQSSMVANGIIGAVAGGATGLEATAGAAIGAASAAHAAAAAAAAGTAGAVLAADLTVAGICATGTIAYSVSEAVVKQAIDDDIASMGWYSGYNHRLAVTGGWKKPPKGSDTTQLQWEKLKLIKLN